MEGMVFEEEISFDKRPVYPSSFLSSEWDVDIFCDPVKASFFGGKLGISSLVDELMREPPSSNKVLSLSDQVGFCVRCILFNDPCSSDVRKTMEDFFPFNYISVSPPSLTLRMGSHPYTTFGGEECTRVKCEVEASFGERGFKIDRLLMWDVPYQTPNPHRSKRPNPLPHPLSLLFG